MLTTLGFLLLSSVHFMTDWMLMQWAIGLSLCALLLGGYLLHRLGTLPGTLLTYLCLEGVYVFAYKWNRFMGFSAPERAALVAVGGYATAAILILSISLSVCRRRFLVGIYQAMPIFTLFNAALVVLGAALDYLNMALVHFNLPAWPKLLSGRLPGGHGYVGFLDYAGMNGVLLALGWPFFGSLAPGRVRTFSITLVLLAIALSKSSIPIGVLVVCMIAYSLHQKTGTLRAWSVWLVAVLFAGWMAGFRHLFDSADRFKAYKLFMRAWWHGGAILCGTGLGSFQVLGPRTQRETGFQIYGDTIWNWFWLHSDWLQVLFELGIIGLLLTVILYLDVLRRLWNERGAHGASVFSFACGLGGAAVFDYPARYFITAFLMAWVVAWAYRIPSKTETSSLGR